MAKANWCMRTDQDIVLEKLMYGGNVCNKCKLQCTTLGGRLIIGRTSYDILNIKNGNGNQILSRRTF